LGLDPELIELYRKRQPTISEHQQGIAGYLRLRSFDDAEAAQMEQFLFEESCRLAAYTFRDERDLLWYSTIFSAAERKTAYVIDGLCSGPCLVVRFRPGNISFMSALDLVSAACFRASRCWE
jgi:hypothetical protein